MSLNPYAAPSSTTTIHRLSHWKAKWAYAGTLAVGIVASLAGVSSSLFVLVMIAAAVFWIKRTWEFLPPRHRGSTEPWMAAAIHCVPVVNLVWMVIFNRRVADVLNDTLRPYSPKRVSPVLAVGAMLGPALSSALIVLALSSGTQLSPAGKLALTLSAFVGRVLYFVWMWSVDGCCEEILALKARAATEEEAAATVKPKKKKAKAKPRVAETV